MSDEHISLQLRL